MFNVYCWRCFASALYLRWRRLLEMGLFRRVAFWWTGVVLFGGGEWILCFECGSGYYVSNVLLPWRCLLLALFCIGIVFASMPFIGDGIVSEGCILADGRCFNPWRGVDIIF